MNDVTISQLLGRICQLLEDNSVAIGKEEITLVSATPTPLNPPEGAKSALIQVESSETTAAALRFWEDGSTPSGTSGMFRSHGDFLDVLTAQNLTQFRAFSLVSEGTTKLFVTYYK